MTDSEGPWSPAGAGPFLAAGDVVQWRYGRRCDPMRVVRDDKRGLVAWLAADTETVASSPADGMALRDKALAERFLGERVATLAAWRGGGIVRIAPTDRPFAIAEWARADLVEGRAWPLDDEWTTWRPPAAWEVPLLPDTPLVAEARRTTLPG